MTGSDQHEPHLPIRDLTVAAPLKQGDVWPECPVKDASPSPYPRPDGRGPIEASSLTWYAPILETRWTIRDLTVAAPLKRDAMRLP